MVLKVCEVGRAEVRILAGLQVGNKAAVFCSGNLWTNFAVKWDI